MRVDITGHQIDVTQALHDYVTEKLERLQRHSDALQDIRVVLSVDKLVHRAEATINAINRTTLHADSTAENMYAAIDLLADKLDRQVLKFKEKLTDHHRGESAVRSATFS
jgi:putative sigma-54 modulation protein